MPFTCSIIDIDEFDLICHFSTFRPKLYLGRKVNPKLSFGKKFAPQVQLGQQNY